MTSYIPPTDAQSPLPPPPGMRSRGTSGASMNRHHPDNYLAPPNTGQMPQQGASYFPPQPLGSNQMATGMQSHAPPAPTPNYAQYPLAPNTGLNTPGTPNNPPYPTADPWEPESHTQQRPDESRRRLSASSARSHRSHDSHRSGRSHRSNSSRHRRSPSASPGLEEEHHHHHRHYDQEDEHQHSHHHHRYDDDARRSHEDGRRRRDKRHREHGDSADLKRTDTRRPTIGDTVYSIFGVAKDYLGPVRRE